MEKSGRTSVDAEEIAISLLKLGSVQLKVQKPYPFKWVSGILSPVYCDNRKVNSNVEIRKQVINSFVKLIKEKFPAVEVIGGIATGGISYGALIADKLNLPFIYIRQAKKEHGMMKQVEGYFEPGQKVVVIEDHISTGLSSLNAVNALREAELNVLGLVSIVTYDFPSANAKFKEAKVENYSLCNLDTILDVSLSDGSINVKEKEEVLRFRDEYIG